MQMNNDDVDSAIPRRNLIPFERYMLPKLIRPNSEQDVASVFIEARLSAGKNGVVIYRQGEPHIISRFLRDSLESCHCNVNDYHFLFLLIDCFF